ncbi:hypothetical protein Tco_0411323 [Tanacetum coccineum]
MTLSPPSFRKRYRGTSEPIIDTKTKGEESEAECTESKSEESEDDDPDSRRLHSRINSSRQSQLRIQPRVGQSYRSVPDQQIADETPTHRLHVCTTWEDPKNNTVYIDIKCDMPPVHSPAQTLSSPVQIPSSPRWSPEPLSNTPVIPSPIVSIVTIVAVDEGDFFKIGAQLELHESILHDHTERLDAFLPSLFEGYGRDFTELFARSRAVREEIHSQRFRLRSLEQGHEQATITFGALWQPVLALEAWT